jgi:hypothetical protein
MHDVLAAHGRRGIRADGAVRYSEGGPMSILMAAMQPGNASRR